MNLNVTLEFACYTQYGEYMYTFIYGKTSGPTITPNVIATLPHFAVKLYSALKTTLSNSYYTNLR